MQARTIDSRISTVVNEHLDALSNRIQTTAFPATYRAMLSSYAQTDSLKAAILDAHESGNTYASMTLRRCLCEHYLEFLYIWVRFTLEKSDAAAIEYRQVFSTHVLLEGLDILVETYCPGIARAGSAARAHPAAEVHHRSIVELLARTDTGISPDDLPLLDRVIQTYVMLATFGEAESCMGSDRPVAWSLGRLNTPDDEMEFVVALPAVVFMFAALAIAREYPEHDEVAPTVCALIEQSILGK